MTRAEASRLGVEKAAEVCRQARLRRIEKYELSPAVCGNCGNTLPYDKRRHKFCNKSCAATHNNKGSRKHGEPPNACLVCGKETRDSSTLFCSKKHWIEHRYEQFIQGWLSGDIEGETSNGTSFSKHIVRWVYETYGHKCSICGLTDWQGKPVPLVLDHIDGNASNNRPENFRLVCGNCNMQLPTFAGRNRGSGSRPWRNEQYRSAASG